MEDEARIVGGSEATTGQFPYQLSFQQDAFLGGQYHFCGAEIYDEVRCLAPGFKILRAIH